MKKCLLAALMIAAFATAASSAETWYLGYNGKRCEIFAEKRPNWNMLSLTSLAAGRREGQAPK